MTNLSLSKILDVNVSTYENDSMDSMYDAMENDLEECWIQKFSDTWFEIDDGLDFNAFKLDVAKYMKQQIEADLVNAYGFDLECMLQNYGIKYNGMKFYTPNAYNFDTDSLDIMLELIDQDWSIEKYKLEENIEYYIENILTPSRDWYMSLEPTRFEDIARNDYCVLYAILKKEWVLDLMKETLKDFVGQWYCELVDDNCKDSHYYRFEDGKEIIYDLDYDAKKLIKREII